MKGGGEGCTCGAWAAYECGCDVDWTDPEVYILRDQIERIERKWVDTHGCIHTLYDEEPIFCPTCKPCTDDLKKALNARYEESNDV